MTTSIAAGGGRHIDPDALICPACTRLVRPEPPSLSQQTEDEVPGQEWSHLDGSALCSQLCGALAAPVARDRVAGTGRGGR